MSLTIQRTTQLKSKPQDESQLGFGRLFTDHMFVTDYRGGVWVDPRIVPYGPFAMDPASMVFHYGQADFEGLKAYRRADGGIQLFRPMDNFNRLNLSNGRLCIPEIDAAAAVQHMKELVKIETEWVPHSAGTSLYIRPFIFATDPFVGVRASNTYIFCIILSPVGAYYAEGLKPVKIYVEDEYVRAVQGGMGFTKAAANYAASLAAGKKAHDMGYSQVLWLDGVERKYIDEVGAMNIFFKIDGRLVTPNLYGSILGGITRDSVIQLAKSWGVPVEERRIAIQEVYDAAKAGTLEEVFGTGTAAVVSPVGGLHWNGQDFAVADGGMGALTQRLYDTLTGIQYGVLPDPFGWVEQL